MQAERFDDRSAHRVKCSACQKKHRRVLSAEGYGACVACGGVLYRPASLEDKRVARAHADLADQRGRRP